MYFCPPNRLWRRGPEAQEQPLCSQFEGPEAEQPRPGRGQASPWGWCEEQSRRPRRCPGGGAMAQDDGPGGEHQPAKVLNTQELIFAIPSNDWKARLEFHLQGGGSVIRLRDKSQIYNTWIAQRNHRFNIFSFSIHLFCGIGHWVAYVGKSRLSLIVSLMHVSQASGPKSTHP